MPQLAWALSILLFQAQSPRLTEYLDLAQSTLRQPVTTDDLRAAFLSPDGISQLRTLFEETLEHAIQLDDTLVTPERGGEAMLVDGRIILVDYPDPVHPIVRRMVELSGDPAAMLALLRESVEGERILQNTGGLHALLYQLVEQPPTPERMGVLRDVLRRTVQTHFKTWTTDPRIQAENIEKTAWQGRYAGFWHVHPPRVTEEGYGVGIEPSVADMHNAIELGQFITVVFQPGGFDVYDLSGVALAGVTDLTLVRLIPYRDPEWQAHFAARLRIAQGSSTP